MSELTITTEIGLVTFGALVTLLMGVVTLYLLWRQICTPAKALGAIAAFLRGMALHGNLQAVIIGEGCDRRVVTIAEISRAIESGQVIIRDVGEQPC